MATVMQREQLYPRAIAPLALLCRCGERVCMSRADCRIAVMSERGVELGSLKGSFNGAGNG
jgi:hypothetical protein